MTGALATLRAAKGGIPDGERGGRNRLVARGYMGQQRPGEQVKGVKTASEGRAVEASGN